MNKAIKIISLAFLLCTPAAYAMENNAIIPAIDEPCAAHQLPFPDEVFGEIFKQTYNMSLNYKTIGRFRSVNKRLYHILNPIAIRQLFNWDTSLIVNNLMKTKSNTNKDNYKFTQFLANMIKDQPELYANIMHRAIHSNDADKIKILLENGANPNYQDANFTDPFLLYAHMCYLGDYNSATYDIFNLLIHHGADIYKKDTANENILDKALADAQKGNNRLLTIILDNKDNLHPQYQERINKALTFEKNKNKGLLSFLAIMGSLFIHEIYSSSNTCTLF